MKFHVRWKKAALYTAVVAVIAGAAVIGVGIASSRDTSAPSPVRQFIRRKLSQAENLARQREASAAQASSPTLPVIKVPAWEANVIPAPQNPLVFSSASEGWFSSASGTYGGSGRLYESTDAGHTWFSPLSSSAVGSYIDFLNSQDGWVVGGSGGILRTTDGGAAWQTLPEPSGGSANRIQVVDFVTPAVGWAVTAASGLVATTDGGSTWVALSNAPHSISDVCFASQQDGWVTTRSGIYQSLDAGQSWSSSPEYSEPIAGDQPMAIACSGSSAWALLPLPPLNAAGYGSAEVLAGTSDNGATWRALYSTGWQVPERPDVPAAGQSLLPLDTMDFNLVGLTGEQDLHLVATGSTPGDTLGADNLLGVASSTDGGASFSIQTIADVNSPLIDGASFPSDAPSDGWVLAEYQVLSNHALNSSNVFTLYATTNGGGDWTPISGAPWW